MLTLAEWINSLSGYSLPGPAGLQASYYSDNNLTTLKLQRIDPQINNIWGADRPTTLVGFDNFSATWSGYLYLPTTGTFTLSIDSDDGIQLLTAGQFIINGWTLTNPMLPVPSFSYTDSFGCVHAVAVRRRAHG